MFLVPVIDIIKVNKQCTVVYLMGLHIAKSQTAKPIYIEPASKTSRDDHSNYDIIKYISSNFKKIVTTPCKRQCDSYAYLIGSSKQRQHSLNFLDQVF